MYFFLQEALATASRLADQVSLLRPHMKPFISIVALHAACHRSMMHAIYVVVHNSLNPVPAAEVAVLQRRAVSEWKFRKVKFVPGGSTRHRSISAGVAAVAPDADVIVVHDAVRPFVSRIVSSPWPRLLSPPTVASQNNMVADIHIIFICFSTSK